MEPALVGAALRTPSVCFTDCEPMAVQNSVLSRFGTCVVTPECFLRDLGPRHVRMPGYKELAYLHPNHFSPDASVREELGVKAEEPYAVVRFSSFRAGHDLTRRSFTVAQRREMVDRMEKHLKVFVSSEGRPDDAFTGKLLPTHPSRIHHALSFARFLVTDTGTMATEAAMLGTPAVMHGSAVRQFGNFCELQDRYGLLEVHDDAEAAIEAAVALAARQVQTTERTAMRDRLLADKVDMAEALFHLVVEPGI